MKRRQFLGTAMGAGMLAAGGYTPVAGRTQKPDYDRLKDIINRPVLKRELFPDPVIIESVELLRYEDNFICRVRSVDGAEGLSVSNNFQMVYLYPVQVLRVNPFFHGRDARDLDTLIDELYIYKSNYKYQSLAIWVPVATVELAVLDMLGRIAGRSIAELIGTIHNRTVAVYQANNYRGKSAEESIELIKRDVAETGARALKFKIGGRMGDAEVPPGRSERLIPLMRPTFGEDIEIYADANGAYTVEEAVRFGRLLEQHGIDFYEEPVPFDHYQECRQVADALDIPLAGGGQESSMHHFRWLIANRVLQIVQPDQFYFGGMIRSMKVARMAQQQGFEITPHISGAGLGWVYMLHFVAAIPNAGRYHEFKGVTPDLPVECATSSLKSEDGIITVPTGPGSGVDLDPGFIQKHQVVQV